MEKIRELFRQWSAKPVFEKIEDGDFEWVFHFCGWDSGPVLLLL